MPLNVKRTGNMPASARTSLAQLSPADLAARHQANVAKLQQRIADLQARRARLEAIAAAGTLPPQETSRGMGMKLLEKTRLVHAKELSPDNPLVQGDSRRSQNASVKWVQRNASISPGHSIGTEVAPGLAVAVGMSGEVEVNSISGEGPSASPPSLRDLLRPASSAELKAAWPVPGSEFMYRGRAALDAEATFGASQRLGAGPVGAGVQAGASLGVDTSQEWTKNLKVLDRDNVYVHIGRAKEVGRTASLGASAWLDLQLRPVVEEMIDHPSKQVPKYDQDPVPYTPSKKAILAGDMADRVSSKIANATTNELSISSDTRRRWTTEGQAILNLSTPEGRRHYDTIMNLSPAKAADYIRANRLGAIYTGQGKSRHTNLTFSIGGKTLASRDKHKSHESGQIVNGDQLTNVSEASFTETVSGVVSEFIRGQTHETSFVAGQLQEGVNGPKKDAVSLMLDLNDKKSKGYEINEWLNFGRNMGVDTKGLPTSVDAKREYGRGRYKVQLAMVQDEIDKVHRLSRQQLAEAIAQAQNQIEGTGENAPWTRPDFSYRYIELPRRNPDYNAMAFIRTEYNKTYGRNLNDDIAMWYRTERILDAVDRARKDNTMKNWLPLAKAVGDLNPEDMRIVMLALRNVAGAKIVQMSANVADTEVNFAAEAGAPMRLGEYVETIIGPPN